MQKAEIFENFLVHLSHFITIFFTIVDIHNFFFAFFKLNFIKNIYSLTILSNNVKTIVAEVLNLHIEMNYLPSQ